MLSSLIVVILGSPMASTTTTNLCSKFGYLELYDEPRRGGNSTVLYTNTDLRDPLDNKMQSFCVHKAIVILLTEHKFNENSDDGDSIWAFSTGYTCFDVESTFRNRISSVRFDTYYFDKPRLTLYQKEGFRGVSQPFSADFYQTTRDDISSSIVLSDLEPWTIYDQANYTGAAACIYPRGNRFPGFYAYKQTLGSFAGRVRSGKRGCHVDPKLNVGFSVFADNLIKYLSGSYRSYP